MYDNGLNIICEDDYDVRGKARPVRCRLLGGDDRPVFVLSAPTSNLFWDLERFPIYGGCVICKFSIWCDVGFARFEM